MKWFWMLFLVVAPLGALETHGEFRAGHDVEKTSVAFTLIRLEVTQAPVTLYGSVRTWFWFDFPGGRPFRNIYDVGARVDWKNLFLDVNHFCNHPVYSEMKRYEWLNNIWGETITTVSIGVRW